MHHKVIIITAPSGSGKTTLVQYLLSRFPQLEFSVSACTRAPRQNEENGRDYYFISVDEFKKRVAEGAFVEYEEVYKGNFYGTLKTELQRIWNKKHIVLFDVDVKGAYHLKGIFGEEALTLFIKAPSLEILEQRLRNRGTESEEKIQMRLEKVKTELEMEDKFDIVLVNDRIEQSQVRLEQIVNSFIEKQ